MGAINTKQKKEVINAYYYRMQALGIDIKIIDLEKKLLPLKFNYLKNLFSEIMKGNKLDIITLLNKLGIPASNKNEPTNNLNELMQKENIDSGTNNSLGGKQYVLTNHKNIQFTDDEAA